MAYDAEATTIKEQLERAKDAIRKHGHVKGMFVGSSGQLCTFGAIALAANGVGTSPYSIGTLAAAALDIVADQPDVRAAGGICEWNNQPETTAEDVIALFDRTIASL